MKKNTIFHGIIISGILLAGCASTGEQTAKKPENASLQISGKVIQKAKDAGIKRVAVMDFTSIDDKVSPEGRLLADRVVNNIVNDGFLSVIERSRIEQVLTEQKLQASGLVDQATVKSLGRLLGVEAVILGTLADLGGMNEINSRMIAVQTGEILCAVSCRCGVESTDGAAPEIKNEVSVRRAELAIQKKENPKVFRKKIINNKKLLKFRQENPGLFIKLVNTKKRLFKLAEEKSDKFLRLVEQGRVIPIGSNMMEVSKALKLMRVYFPEDYERVFEIRRRLLNNKKEKEQPSRRKSIRKYGRPRHPRDEYNPQMGR